ncbi:MAG: thiamine phosphate synthase [Acidobacteria bacterium]|nr:thiamine phosphate synthase [Acidobacteriota bacterium]
MGAEDADQHSENSVIRHCITEGLQQHMPSVDVIQLRAKEVDAGELLRRARRIRATFNGTLLINDRVDVCLAAGADGVHLPAHRLAPSILKQRFGLIVGVSCHDLEEVRRAEQEGADYAYLSPIFKSSSKPGYGPALGLDTLRRVVEAVSIPVIALGGVTKENEVKCIESGAAGIAGISYFGQ